jgi:hypothetical protein
VGPFRWLVVALAAAVCLVVIDRLLLAAEARGWIYWRRSKPSPGTTAGALLELHALLEASRKHTAEVVRDEGHEEDDEGGPGPEGDDEGPRR